MNQSYSTLYSDYNKRLKPLTSEIEGRTEMFEKELLLQLAIMFDEIALHAQAKEENQEDEAAQHLHYADDALRNCIEDSYQTLIMVIDKNIKIFCHQAGKSLSKLNGGRFIGPYRQKLKDARNFLCREDYKKAYELYSEVEELCNKQTSDVIVYRTSHVRTLELVMEWLLSICISIGAGFMVSCYSLEIKNFIKPLIDWLL